MMSDSVFFNFSQQYLSFSTSLSVIRALLVTAYSDPFAYGLPFFFEASTIITSYLLPFSQICAMLYLGTGGGKYRLFCFQALLIY